jgi:hypothetical protein
MVRTVLFTAVVVFGLLAMPRPALADDGGESDGCATTLLECYEAAAKIDNFWYRWAAGIDCELNFTSCVRVKLIGS